MGSGGEDELVPKLVWRVKLVAEFDIGETTEVEVTRFERDEHAGLAAPGLRLAEAKRLTAAIQAAIVPAQVTIAREHRRACVACARVLPSKGHYTARFRSLFGDVPIRVQRLLACSCEGAGEAKSCHVRFEGVRTQNSIRLFFSHREPEVIDATGKAARSREINTSSVGQFAAAVCNVETRVPRVVLHGASRSRGA